MIRPALLSLPFFALAACGVPSEPIVSDFNGASVKIAMINYMGEGARNDASDAEAARICATSGKKRAEYASTRPLPGYQLEHLYLCL